MIRGMHKVLRGSTLLLLVGDIAILFGSLVLTLLIRYREFPSEEVINQHLAPFVLLFGIWLLTFLIAGLYDRYVVLARKQIPWLILRAQTINILLAAVFFFFLPFGIEPKTNLIIYLVVSTALVALWRLYVFPLTTTEKSITALVIGDSPEAIGIANVLGKNPYFQNTCVYTIGSADVVSREELRESVFRFVNQKGVDMIIADMRDPFIQFLTKDFYAFVFTGQNIHFFNLPAMYEELHHRVPPSLIGEAWFLENITTDAPHYAYDFLKRTIDVVGALILLIPCTIIFPFVYLVIKLYDGGTIIYKSERIGQYNNPIHIYKFRTMTGMDSGTTLDTVHTVTSVGKFLRMTRIDELPQLVNVLKGDLSFIGPRPELPARAHVYAREIPHYNMRHLIKPGLSGWAQINNFDVPHREVDVARTHDKLSFDLYYLRHRSLFLDIEIALKTINTLLKRSGT